MVVMVVMERERIMFLLIMVTEVKGGMNKRVYELCDLAFPSK